MTDEITPREVSMALQVPHLTLNGWLAKKRVTNLDAQKLEVRSGVSRAYSRGDFYALALVAAASRLGALTRPVGAYARMAVQDYMTGRITFSHVYFANPAPGDEKGYRISYEAPEADDYESYVAINLRAVIANARDSLDLVRKSKAIRKLYLSPDELGPDDE